MTKYSSLCLLLSVGLIAPACAAPAFLATATLTASSAGTDKDLSGLGDILEDGIPADFLGGTGSGLTFAGGDIFLALPDRGPNATPYNPAVDDTVSYISRFHTLTLRLVASPGASLPYRLEPALTATTLLFSKTPLAYGPGGPSVKGLGPGAPARNAAGVFYFVGRSDNFAPGKNSTDPVNARLDPESIRLAPDGKTIFISDEYGPSLYRFDRQTGARIASFKLPANLGVAMTAPTVAKEIAGNRSGRTANKGMEGLALTPDGKTLVGIMQSALLQDAAVAASKKLLRLVSIDVASGATSEYGYLLTDGSGVSEIVAVNGHDFLVEERDGKGRGDGTAAKVKKLYRIDLSHAGDITNLSGAAAAAKAVSKSLVLDIVAVLEAHGIKETDIPEKLEAVTFGQDIVVGGVREHTLYVANDNDFLPKAGGPNAFYVFGLTDSDLPGFVPEDFHSN